MEVIVLIGRVLFAGIFLGSAMAHLGQTEGMTGYAASKGVPRPRPVVLVAGVMLVVGGVSILLGIWPDLGALILVIFLVPTAFKMHAFWKEEDPTSAMNEQTHFLKDMSLAGAALLMFGIFAYGTVDGLMVTGPLFSFG